MCDITVVVLIQRPCSRSRKGFSCLVSGLWGLGFRDLGFEGFRGLGFRDLGFKGFRDLGFLKLRV